MDESRKVTIKCLTEAGLLQLILFLLQNNFLLFATMTSLRLSLTL